MNQVPKPKKPRRRHCPKCNSVRINESDTHWKCLKCGFLHEKTEGEIYANYKQKGAI